MLVNGLKVFSCFTTIPYYILSAGNVLQKYFTPF